MAKTWEKTATELLDDIAVIDGVESVSITQTGRRARANATHRRRGALSTRGDHATAVLALQALIREAGLPVLAFGVSPNKGA